MDAVLNMSWREFTLRRVAYERMQKKEWEKARFVAYWAGAGSAFEPKKMTLEQLLPLEAPRVPELASDSSKDFFAEEWKKYEEEVERQTKLLNQQL